MGTPTEGAGLEDSERFANEGSEGDDKSKGPGTAPDNAVRSGNKAEAEEAGVARGLQEDGQSLRNSSADSEETMERPNAGPAEARQHDSEPSTSSQTRPHGQDGEGDADKNDAIAALESRTKKVTLMDGDPGKIKFGEGTSATDGGGPPAERFEEGSYVREAYVSMVKVGNTSHFWRLDGY